MEPGNRDAERMAVRHADAFGGDIRKNQREEDRMRDIQIGKRGPEAPGEEQPDKLRKTIRFGQEVQQRETQDRPGPYLCKSQVMLMTTYKFLRWMYATRWMDERVVTSEKCWIGIEAKMPELSGEVN